MSRLRSLALLLALAPAALAAPASLPLTSGAFQTLGAESYRRAGLSGSFTTWLADAYRRQGVLLLGEPSLGRALKRRRAQLLLATGAERDRLARDTAAWAHRFVKAALPRFSLERGFEFAGAARSGERQCLLQSVLITGLLQEAGLQAGAVMVWRNLSGQETNLGHVTATLRLPSGHGDLLIDASDPTPFVEHQGLLTWADGGYRFLVPRYGAEQTITGYQRADGGGPVALSGVSALDLAYLRSQFDYYRGERAPGGLLGTGVGRATPAGLQGSERWLQAALRENPHNALAAYVLGHVYRKQGRPGAARAQYLAAAKLYAAQGHTPRGVQDALVWARSAASR